MAILWFLHQRQQAERQARCRTDQQQLGLREPQEQERQVPPGLRMDQRSWRVPQVRRPGHRKDQQVRQRELPELAQHQGQEPSALREQELLSW
jgi:hypothetical protein